MRGGNFVTLRIFSLESRLYLHISSTVHFQLFYQTIVDYLGLSYSVVRYLLQPPSILRNTPSKVFSFTNLEIATQFPRRPVSVIKLFFELSKWKASKWLPIWKFFQLFQTGNVIILQLVLCQYCSNYESFINSSEIFSDLFFDKYNFWTMITRKRIKMAKRITQLSVPYCYPSYALVFIIFKYLLLKKNKN